MLRHTFRCAVLLSNLGCLVACAAADDAAPPVELLWPAGAPGAMGEEEADRPTLTIWLPAAEKATGAGVVVCPGGGYGALAVGHEGKDVADWLNSFGVAAFMVKYRLGPRYRHPAPSDDAKRAVRMVRANATAWGVDPARIGILGFSAGGHLASTVITHFDAGQSDAEDPIQRQSCRPDFAVLIYPVISLTADCAHKGSRDNLLGPSPSRELLESLSNETQVTADTPPTFLVHTSADAGVPPENSLLFYAALRKAAVPAELHIYEKGNHGFGLAPKDPVLSTWPKHCQDWLVGHGFVK